MKKQITWALAGTGSFLISLVALAPLPILAQQLIRTNPDISMAGVNGTLWKGEIQQLNTHNTTLSDLSWKFAPRQLLTGYVAADLRGYVQNMQVQGICGVSLLTNLKCEPLILNGNASQLTQFFPILEDFALDLSGSLRANFSNIRWDRKGIPIADGSIIWSQARIHNPLLQANLGGEYEARIREGTRVSEALDINLLSRDSNIVLDGKILVEKAGTHNTELSLRPSGEADENLANLLYQLAPRQTDGSIRLRYSGRIPGLPSQATVN